MKHNVLEIYNGTASSCGHQQVNTWYLVEHKANTWISVSKVRLVNDERDDEAGGRQQKELMRIAEVKGFLKMNE